MRVMFFVGLIVILSGCSGRQLFDVTQESKRNECRHLPPAQQAECFREVEPSYEDYQRRRREVIE
ncbi:MAG: hypothetical protein LAT77_00870 [Aliidiomarina sp.]|uniref:hypothetical protein n=1 Tax=Aliidiomarina sp. TaxID=1872439 RepID=UPI0025BFA24D|nr:hypothetical protein [Aliidiomarina sp.]MCH8500444.1 hypothetical protein [Aliidiomarina sp.]